MFTRWKLAPNIVTQRLAALRLLYIQVLKRGWSAAETPCPKKVLHLPHVLSHEEIARLIGAAEMPFHHILVMTLYVTGVRRAEVAHWIPLRPRFFLPVKVLSQIFRGKFVAGLKTAFHQDRLAFCGHLAPRP